MKKLLLFFVAVTLLHFTAKSQVYMRDINGTPFSERNTADLGGSPFFNDQFLKGSIKMEDNSVYKDLYLRYDQEADQLVYRKEVASASMLPSGRVTQFSIELPGGEAKFRSITDDKGDAGFYQILQEGKTSLLKKTKKRIVENVEYNSTSRSKSMKTEVDYFLQTADKKLIPIKKDKKSFTKVLADKQNEVATYIEQNKLNLKSDNDMSKLISYYNTL